MYSFQDNFQQCYNRSGTSDGLQANSRGKGNSLYRLRKHACTSLYPLNFRKAHCLQHVSVEVSVCLAVIVKYGMRMQTTKKDMETVNLIVYVYLTLDTIPRVNFRLSLMVLNDDIFFFRFIHFLLCMFYLHVYL